ncbi:MAG TPA: DUF423 domain-containing protein [Gammaproteobacteria bacterium]|nr:DUF423 domain-containing protein [Gammaproteobacteria bacterium]
MKFLAAGALNAALSILLGAFAAHGLKQRLDAEALAIFHTGVDYHAYHALGLMLVGLLIHNRIAPSHARIAGKLMLAGILIFSGSLYLLAATDLKWLGAITPIGGVSFIAAWLTLAVGLWKYRKDDPEP